ncbi:MAG: serine/threonine protein kinase [Bacteroides sp.]
MLHELGHGADGTVYLVRHKRLNTLRAVKFIKSSLRSQDYLNEVNLLKNLKHSGIPVIYDIEESEQGIYVIEEYIDGCTLAQTIHNNGKYQLPQACEVIVQLCDILEFLHNNEEYSVIHLDLKPENIMIDKSGNVKLIDFGNAAIAGNGVKSCMGSTFFAAPEQYHSLKPDRLCDIYGVGMLLLFMLTKKHEWSGIDEIQSVEISRVIKKCVHHNPIQRYRSAGRIKADIEKILKKQVSEASKLSLTVNLTGTKRGIGTTHIALAITHFLTEYGIKAVYADKTGENRIYDFLTDAKLCSNAAYSMFGIYVLPDYGDYVELDEKWEVIVCDCGDCLPYCDVHADVMGSNTLNILVGSAKCLEEKFFETKLNELTDKMQEGNISLKTAVILNHMSGRQFYDYLSKKRYPDSMRIFRMPCKYEWEKPDEMSDAVFESLLGEYLQKNKAAHSGVNMSWRMIFERVQRIFRKIIGRT